MAETVLSGDGNVTLLSTSVITRPTESHLKCFCPTSVLNRTSDTNALGTTFTNYSWVFPQAVHNSVLFYFDSNT